MSGAALREAALAAAGPARDEYARGLEAALRVLHEWSPASANTDAWLREPPHVVAAIKEINR